MTESLRGFSLLGFHMGPCRPPDGAYLLALDKQGLQTEADFCTLLTRRQVSVCPKKSPSMMQLVLKVGPSRSQDGLESLHIDNLITIKKTKTYSHLVPQIRVAPILVFSRERWSGLMSDSTGCAF